MSIITRYVSKTKNGPVLWLGATATAQLTKEIEALEKERNELRMHADALCANLEAHWDDVNGTVANHPVNLCINAYRTAFPKQP